MKKEYINPAVEILTLNLESIIADSLTQGETNNPFDPDGGDIELSNKRQPLGGTWNSTNWNQVDE